MRFRSNLGDNEFSYQIGSEHIMPPSERDGTARSNRQRQYLLCGCGAFIVLILMLLAF